MEVNKDRVRLLVEALRSGKFVQGRNRLENADGTMCCLGVACRVAMDNGLNIERWQRDDAADGNRVSTYYGDPRGDYSASTLPAHVAGWYGFDDSAPYLRDAIAVSGSSGTVSTIWANDVAQWDFRKIADAFERTYLGTIPGKDEVE